MLLRLSINRRTRRAAHTGYFVSGRMKVVMDDGEEMEYGPGDFAIMAPRHDAWIVGDEPCVVIDWASPTTPSRKPDRCRRRQSARPRPARHGGIRPAQPHGMQPGPVADEEVEVGEEADGTVAYQQR
jgi:hypothetical protein